MRIVREDVKTIKFGEVNLGEVFIAEDDVYIKTNSFYEIEANYAEQESRYRHNAICLSTGYFNLFADCEEVKPCGGAYLTVK